MFDPDGMVRLEVSLQSMKLSMHQMISAKFCEAEIKAAIDRAVTPQAMSELIATSVREAMESVAKEVATRAVQRNESLRGHLLKVCNESIDEHMKFYE